MRYQPNLLNEYGVFQRLNSLLKDSGMDEGFLNRTEHFLYRVTCVLVSLKSMHSSEEQTVRLVSNYLKQIQFDSSNRIAISAEPLFNVYAQIPACLTLLVILQNELIGIFQRIENVGGDVPSSLNKALKKGLTTYGFSQGLSDRVNDYWLSGGKYIRDLRDVNEHHFALVDNSYFYYEYNPGQVIVLLPDNPEEKSVKKITYKLENDAFDVISKSIMALNSLVDSVLENAGYSPEPFTLSMYMGHMGSLETPKNRTLGLMINIESINQTENGVQLVLDTIEMSQIIPDNPNGGNIVVRKMKTDSDLDREQ